MFESLNLFGVQVEDYKVQMTQLEAALKEAKKALKMRSKAQQFKGQVHTLPAHHKRAPFHGHKVGLIAQDKMLSLWLGLLFIFLISSTSHLRNWFW